MSFRVADNSRICEPVFQVTQIQGYIINNLKQKTMNYLKCFRKQNTKGRKGVTKIVREDLTILKWKIQSLILKIKIKIENNGIGIFIFLGLLCFCIFAVDIENDRDFWTWMWLLNSQISFFLALYFTIINKNKQ